MTKHVSLGAVHTSRNSRGITLVALVVTLIVLLILAGVTITSLVGDHGIIKKAQEAVNAMNDAIQSEQEEINDLIEELNSVIIGEGEDTKEILSAGDIATAVASNPEAYYGKTVSGYTCTNSSAVENWKIFYAGNDFSSDSSYHVYLIADDYIARENIPASSAGNKLNDGSADYPRAAYFTNDYIGSASITNADIKKLNNDYFTKNYTSTNNNMKSVAYMLDTNAWSVYAGEDAEYAVGGPSIEMLMKSYSQKHGVDYRAQASNPTGYQISTDGGANWNTSYNAMLATSDSLYVINTNANATAYWVASPAAFGLSDLMAAYYTGNVYHPNYNTASCGFRPLVCLNSDVQFEQLENGNFQIVS